jgi:predicted dithiol-disulfide oxidoreductase (DUF899 family)
MFGPSYEACPTCSSMADGFNGLVPHLRARDVTMLLVSRAPLEKLQAHKRRMGWSIPWASSADSDFNFDFGVSYPDELVREQMGPALDDPATGLPQMAAATGTDVAGYASEGFGSSAFVLDDGVVYYACSTQGRGVEFLMGYYPIPDRVPKGRDEGDSPAPASMLWIRHTTSPCGSSERGRAQTRRRRSRYKAIVPRRSTSVKGWTELTSSPDQNLRASRPQQRPTRRAGRTPGGNGSDR